MMSKYINDGPAETEMREQFKRRSYLHTYLFVIFIAICRQVRGSNITFFELTCHCLAIIIYAFSN